MGVVRQTAEAARDRFGMKVHEQADAEAGETQIAEELRLVDRLQVVDCFELYDQGAFDDEVEAIPEFELHVLIAQRYVRNVCLSA